MKARVAYSIPGISPGTTPRTCYCNEEHVLLEIVWKSPQWPSTYQQGTIQNIEADFLRLLIFRLCGPNAFDREVNPSFPSLTMLPTICSNFHARRRSREISNRDILLRVFNLAGVLS